jgi:hypothetical protein
MPEREMAQKRCRIVDDNVLEMFRWRPCDACGLRAPSDPAHIKTVGSGGDDVPSNLMSLCREHHRMQEDGWGRFLDMFPQMEQVLNRKGWGVINLFGVRKVRRL